MFTLTTDWIMLQNIIAFWQWTPVLVNIPLWFAAPFVSSTSAASRKSDRSDLAHLKLLYTVTFVINIISHWTAIIGILTSPNPQVSLASVFLPSKSTWKTSMDYGVLYMFQWDWIICGTAVLYSAWIAIIDVQRVLHGAAAAGQMINAAGAIAALTVLGGPGGAIVAVWRWREEKLALIEDRLSSEKKQ